MSPLAWGRGLKLLRTYFISLLIMSPLAWGRGLKLFFLYVCIVKLIKSPLAWGRGLKHQDRTHRIGGWCRPSCGGVD